MFFERGRGRDLAYVIPYIYIYIYIYIYTYWSGNQSGQSGTSVNSPENGFQTTKQSGNPKTPVRNRFETKTIWVAWWPGRFKSGTSPGSPAPVRSQLSGTSPDIWLDPSGTSPESASLHLQIEREGLKNACLGIHPCPIYVYTYLYTIYNIYIYIYIYISISVLLGTTNAEFTNFASYYRNI